MKIAITGGIGSGKSTLIEHLRTAFPRARFVSMDGFVDALYQDESWLGWLEARFGTRERSHISALAFSDQTVLAQLNAQSALKIGVTLGRLLEQPGLLFVEFPLLFESGLEGEFDHTILVTANREVRIARVVARGRKTAEQAAQVLDAQMPEHMKAAKASAIVDTSRPGTQASCAQTLVGLIDQLLEGCGP